MTTIVSTCPHCGNEAPDIWETLPNNEIVEMRCSQCRGAYSIYLMECYSCEAEHLFSWLHTPSADALGQLVCEKCGKCGDDQSADEVQDNELYR